MRYLMMLFASVSLAVAPALLDQEAGSPKLKTPSESDLDITEQVREYNSDKYASPPTKFRAGHVTPKEFDANSIRSTDDGFSIQLPSKAPIPTLTIYNGRVYASGGFHSKEFYCLDATSGKLIWAVTLDDYGPSSAVCHDNVCVFNTESCTIFALDASSGKMLWSHWLGDPLMSTPTIANGMVFSSYPVAGGAEIQLNNQSDKQLNVAPAGQAQPTAKAPKPKALAKAKRRPPATHALAAFDLKTGEILWQRWLDSDCMTAPVAIDGELYVTSFGGTVYRFRQKDGHVVSSKKMRATSAPVIVGGDVMVTRRADQGDRVQEAICSLDRESGREKLVAGTKRAIYLDQRAQSKTEFAEKGAQLDAGNGFAGGAPAAANPTAGLDNIGYGNVSTLQAFQGSRLLHFRGDNINCPGDEIVCTDAKSGREKWKVKLDGDLKKVGGFLAAPPAEAGGKVFVSTLKGEVLELDPKTGKIDRRHQIGAPVRFQPAIEDGRIYVGTQDGKVVCVDTGDQQLTGWSTWGGNSAHTGLATR